MPFQITIAETDESFLCRKDQNVLAAMLHMRREGIPVGCRGGGCGICRVQVVGEAKFRTLKMSRAQVTESDLAQGICLACKLIPEGDLTVKALGELRQKLI